MSNIDEPMDVADAPAADAAQNTATHVTPDNKGKGKGTVNPDKSMDEDDDDDDEEEDDDFDPDQDEDMGVEEDFEEIDPSAILSTGRRTRGVKVDYTSTEALQKAGLENSADPAEGDEEEEFVAPDNAAQAD